MKKLVLGITVLAIILFASSSMAAGPKVPKYLCLQHSYNTGWYTHLAFKSIGSVPTSGGNVKMYTLSGFAYVNVFWTSSRKWIHCPRNNDIACHV